jgi:type I restriction enzyme S subunit
MKWIGKTLAELGTVGRGKSRHRPRNAAHLYGGNHPFIQTGDIQAARFYINEYTQTYSDEGLKQSKLWPKDTLCISIVGANTAATAILGIEACFPDSVIGFLADGEISDVRFVKYALEGLRETLKGISEGTARENLSLEKLLSVKIPTPPLFYQKKIVSIIQPLDDLIENNLKRIKLLEELAQRTYEEWFVKFRINGKQLKINKATGLPEGWKYQAAEELFNIKIGKTPPREQVEWFTKDQSGIKWVSIKGINDSRVFVFDTDEGITSEGVSKFNMNIAKRNTVLLSFKLTVGRVAITTEDMATNEAIAHFNDIGYLSKEFLYCYLKGFNYNSLGSTSSIGTAINSKIVKSLQILVSPLEISQRFSERISPIFNLIENLLRQNRLLEEGRDILLPRLMSGAIDVEDVHEEMLSMAAEGS